MSIRTQRRSRISAAAVVAALVASLFAFIAPAGALTPASPVVRYSGADRYATAADAAIAVSTPNGEANIILASGENFPDGLAAAYLAGAVNGPLLLTARDSLPVATANALGELAAPNATLHIVGGTAAVSEGVASQLEALGYTVERISGADRYATAAAVAAAGADLAGVGSFQGAVTAIVTTGENFPDALAAGALAYADRHPIVLTTGAALSGDAEEALSDLGIKRVILLGGTAAVSEDVAEAITAKGIAVQRVFGANRYATAAELAKVLVSTEVQGGAGWGAPGFNVTLALGTNFPDALSASQVAGTFSAPIILTGSLPAESEAFLQANAARITGLRVIGGTAAISAETLTAARTAATPVAVTATITALEGRTSFDIEFSEPVVASTVNPGDFTFASVDRTVKADSVATLPTADLTAATQFRVNLEPQDAGPPPVPTPFKVGDVVNLVGGSVTAVSGRTNAATTVTVAADTTAPSASVRVYVGGDTIWVTFSEPVSKNTAGDAPGTAGQVTVKGVARDLNPLGGADEPAQIWTATIPGADPLPGSGDSASIVAKAFVDVAGNGNTAASATARTDSVRPTVSSATYSVAPKDGASITLEGDGAPDPDPELTITAKSTGIAAGLAGNEWKIIPGTAGTGTTITVTVNTNIKTIAVNGHVDNAVEANRLAQALAADPVFNANFDVAVGVAGLVDIPTVAAEQLLANGTSTVTMRIQFSEPLSDLDLNEITLVTSGTSFPLGDGGVNPTLTSLASSGDAVFSYEAAVGAKGLPQHLNIAADAATDLSGLNKNLAASNIPVNAG